MDGGPGGVEARKGRRVTADHRTLCRRRSHRLGISVLLLLVLLVVEGSPFEGTDGAPLLLVSTIARQGGLDQEGPTIVDVRATPPRAHPGEMVSLGATITDASGVRAAWVRVEGPGLDLNVTLVGFGASWFLNRSWETTGVYRFDIGAQDGAGNINTAPGSFHVQDSLAGTFGLVLLLGTLLAAGAGALVVLWIRWRRVGKG